MEAHSAEYLNQTRPSLKMFVKNEKVEKQDQEKEVNNGAITQRVKPAPTTQGALDNQETKKKKKNKKKSKKEQEQTT